MSKARRYNSDKPRHSLSVTIADEMVARRWTKGAEKYTLVDEEGIVIDAGEFNWRKGMSTLKVIDSLKRHLAAIEKGEDIDKDWPENYDKKYGLSTHYDGIIVNAQILLSQYYRNYPDDRIIEHKYKRIGIDCDIMLDISYDYVFPYPPVVFVNCSNKEREILDDTRVVTIDSNLLHTLREYKVEEYVTYNYEDFVMLNNSGIKTYLMTNSTNYSTYVGYLRIYHIQDIY